MTPSELKQSMPYAEMVSGAMASEKGAQEWYDYLRRLKAHKERVSELFSDVRKSNPGLARDEILRKIAPQVKGLGLTDSLCSYSCVGYQDGPVISICNVFGVTLNYAHGKPVRCESCKGLPQSPKQKES